MFKFLFKESSIFSNKKNEYNNETKILYYTSKKLLQTLKSVISITLYNRINMYV